MPNHDRQSCATCKFSTHDSSIAYHVRCRRFPPYAGRGRPIWPEPYLEDVCGEYKEKIGSEQMGDITPVPVPVPVQDF